MAAFEGAGGVGIAAEADAVAEGPDADDFVELIASGGEAGGGGVGIVEERDRARLMPRACSVASTFCEMRAPLSWARLGESSTMPARTMPGKAMPMASR